MHLLSFNSKKHIIHYTETLGRPVNFAIEDSGTIEFDATDLFSLERALDTLISSVHARLPLDRIAILRCSSGGKFPSSAEAIKGEAIIELVAAHLGILVASIAPQSLPATLGAAKGTKWQDKAKEMFNSPRIVGFGAGIDGAVAAAFKVTKDV